MRPVRRVAELGSLETTPCLTSRPRVRFDEGFQGGMRDHSMGGHDALDGLPDAGEAELAVEEGLEVLVAQFRPFQLQPRYEVARSVLFPPSCL